MEKFTYFTDYDFRTAMLSSFLWNTQTKPNQMGCSMVKPNLSIGDFFFQTAVVEDEERQLKFWNVSIKFFSIDFY